MGQFKIPEVFVTFGLMCISSFQLKALLAALPEAELFQWLLLQTAVNTFFVCLILDLLSFCW